MYIDELRDTSQDFMRSQAKNATILSASLFKKDAEKEFFYNLFSKYIDDEFRNKFLKVATASKMIGINVETIRRKIRNNQITFISESKNRIIYKLNGNMIIKLLENNYQKSIFIENYSFMYPKKTIIILSKIAEGAKNKLSKEDFNNFLENIHTAIDNGVSVDEKEFTEKFIADFNKLADKRKSKKEAVKPEENVKPAEPSKPNVEPASDDNKVYNADVIEYWRKELRLAQFKMELAQNEVSRITNEFLLLTSSKSERETLLNEKANILRLKIYLLKEMAVFMDNEYDNAKSEDYDCELDDNEVLM